MNSLYFTGSDCWISAEMLSPEFLADLRDCGAPGQDASEAVAYVRANYTIQGDADDCRAYLKQFGAWEDSELADHDANLDRLVWLTGSDLREQGEATFSTY